MTDAATLYALTGAAVVGLGLYGLIAQRGLLRRVLAFNVTGSGIFLLFGGLGGSDPVPQALIITGIVVALAATALAVALVVAHARAAGTVTLPEDEA
jgi:multicomponent Na+:H+ antiporter subunit C